MVRFFAVVRRRTELDLPRSLPTHRGCSSLILLSFLTASNALTFGLMVVTAFLTSTITRYIGVRWTLFFGGAGYAPYAA